LQHLDEKKIYTERNGLYFFPLNALEHIKKNFNNCIIKKKNDYYQKESCFVVNPCIKCKANYRFWEHDKINILHDGKILQADNICNHCKHMLQEYVGECDQEAFEPVEGWQFKSNGNDGFLRIKPGYTHSYDFGTDINFDADLIIERMNEYKKRGQWAKHAKEIKKEFCENCFKYRTSTCKSGFHAGRNPIMCMEGKEETLLKVKRKIVKEFGSMSTFFHMLLQCGQTVDYKDPYTHRTSKRVVSVPVIKNGVKGFYMAWTRHPYNIDYYPDRWGHSEEDKKHENFISFSKFKKQYDLKKERYRKRYDELLCCAYLFLRRVAYDPGTYLNIKSYRNYFVSLRIKVYADWGKDGYRFTRMISETGNSRGTYNVEYSNLKDVADAVCLR